MWTFGRKVAFGFAIALALFALIGVVAFRGLSRLDESAGWVTHTHYVLELVTRLMSEMTDAQGAERGFIITGDELMLEPYNEAITAVPGTLAELEKQTGDNPQQRATLEELKQAVASRVQQLDDTIKARRSEGNEGARQLIVKNGKVAMDKIRALTQRMTAEEQRLLDIRDKDARETSATARAYILYGTLLCGLIVGLAGFFIVRSVVGQIGAAVARVQSSSAELQAAATQQASGSRESATAMNEISTTISELLATSRQISDSSRRVSQVAEDTFSAARSGDQLVGRAHESISAIKRQVDVIVAHMLDLGKRSQQIGGILELVGELAEQTNILAINASIEAAGAGDAGKRFGVVADEIRKLADRVGGSTKDIRALIDDMRAAVNATVMATESGTKTVDAGARQFNDVTAALNNIARMMATTTEAAKEIELSTKQQTTAVEQVNIAIANVTKATKETETSSGQTLQTATFLSGLSGELTRMIRPAA